RRDRRPERGRQELHPSWQRVQSGRWIIHRRYQTVLTGAFTRGGELQDRRGLGITITQSILLPLHVYGPHSAISDRAGVLLNQLSRGSEQPRRNGQAECPRSLQIDDKIKFGRQLN